MDKEKWNQCTNKVPSKEPHELVYISIDFKGFFTLLKFYWNDITLPQGFEFTRN